MGLFRKIASLFGIIRDDGHDRDGGGGRRHHDPDGVNPNVGVNARSNGGFGVKVPVTVERAYQGPVITQCDHGEGGVQGFRWYAKRLRIDEDGDVAEEFLEEVLPESSSQAAMDSTPSKSQSQSRFIVRRSSRPARVKRQAIVQDGNILQCVDFNGTLIWV
ncbi:uncharacterized protein LOC116252078 isoform X2 [Nymphaea colorata]|uniref:uncharacterized protein LOC116252078 isoform X2 n=1 Tax=Nymphaea colorata TaxID=210225 RepID=UPI00129E4880|nr:uncharacterized protein LOC116252078 isoform X2 [Nymphaea colorata]